MFTIEIRINGSLISHIYGRNVGTTPKLGDRYEFELYTPESREVKKGQVYHQRADGINELAAKILAHKGPSAWEVPPQYDNAAPVDSPASECPASQ